MSNNATSDETVEQIERLCFNYRRGIITSERAMSMIVQIASTELLQSVVEQESRATERTLHEV